MLKNFFRRRLLTGELKPHILFAADRAPLLPDGFTGPARRLEQLGTAGTKSGLNGVTGQLRALASRIVRTGTDGNNRAQASETALVKP